MLPFLLPTILILYGEFSKGIETRFASRILFYTYTLSVLFPMYTSSPYGIMLAVGVLICGLGYLITIIPNVVSKLFWTITLTSSVLSYASVYLEDYTFLLSVPYYAEYSHYVFRESMIIGLMFVSISEGLEAKDFKLEMFVTGLWVLERFWI